MTRQQQSTKTGALRNSRWRRVISATTAAAFLVTLLVAFQSPQASMAANGSEFNAGNIIDDATFYNSGTMTVGQIQSFLNAQVSKCRSGYTCLKDYSQKTPNMAGRSGFCSAYAGSSRESAASMIYKVSRACGVNPQVLLVLLEKEQSLVGDTWPSAGQYASATGFNCPDSAPCNPEYAGFFNQVYAAAYQFRMYRNYPDSFNNVAGKNNSILYNPDRSCGSSNVFIENQATAGLYDYTPYRPDAAALKQENLYSTGDRCSTYGNRNFWRIFTDWFGSTHTSGGMVRAEGTSAVYIIVGSSKYHISSKEVQSLYRALGPSEIVSKAFLDGFSTGVDLSPVIRDPQTGIVALVQDGRRHRFDSCSRVALWGYQCGDYVNLSPVQVKLLPLATDEVGDFYTVSGRDTIYMIDGKTSYPMESVAAARAFNGGKAPFVGVMPHDAAAKFTRGQTLIEPDALVKSSSGPTVYLITGRNSKVTVPSSSLTSEIGITGSARLVNDSVLALYKTGTHALTSVISCGSSYYLANSGKLSKLESGNLTGIAATPFDPQACETLEISGTISGNAFVQATGSSTVALLMNGKAWPLDQSQTPAGLNAGRTATVSTISAASYALIPKGSTVVAPGTLVRASNSKDVFMVDGFEQKRHLPSWGVADALGLADYRVISPSTVDKYATASPLSQVVSCNGATYFGADGTLYQIDPANKHGLGTTTLVASTCERLTISKAKLASAIWVRTATDSSVYEIVDGKREWVPDKETWKARNSGPQPATSLKIGERQMSAIPLGPPIRTVNLVDPATFIRASNGKDVYFVDGDTRKIHLPSWGVADAFSVDYKIVSAATVEAYQTLGASLGQVVNCGGVPYFGVAGTFYRIGPDNNSGLVITDLAAATCSRLRLANAQAAKAIWIKSPDSSAVYEVVDGTRRWIPDAKTWAARNGGVVPASWHISSAQIATIPIGTPLPPA